MIAGQILAKISKFNNQMKNKKIKVKNHAKTQKMKKCNKMRFKPKIMNKRPNQL